MSALQRSRSAAAEKNPKSGEMSSPNPTFCASAQLTPDVIVAPGSRNALASPTPMMDPMSVCELDAGRAKYHVLRFQRIAEINNEKTIANPAPDPMLTTNSTGIKATIAKATNPDELKTPMRLQIPDHTTAGVGFNVLV